MGGINLCAEFWRMAFKGKKNIYNITQDNIFNVLDNYAIRHDTPNSPAIKEKGSAFLRYRLDVGSQKYCPFEFAFRLHENLTYEFMAYFTSLGLRNTG